MSASMAFVRDGLVSRYGEGFGREQFAWLLQKYDVMPWDEAPEGMFNEM